MAKPDKAQAASTPSINREKRIHGVKAKRLANGNAKTPVLGCVLPPLPVVIPPQLATRFYKSY
ncbi:MAG: hypothetical protein ACI8QI_000593 [Limisphaerales bacterium]